MRKKNPKTIIRSLLEYIGENPDRDGLLETPDRVLRSFEELYSGYKKDASIILRRTFSCDSYKSQIVVGDIDFYSTCEHHLLPFYGTVSIGYVPKGKVVGLSKLPRLVEVFSRRLQLQERLTHEIGEAIDRFLDPYGVAVRIRGRHLCMISRGVKCARAWMDTEFYSGIYKRDRDLKSEFLSKIHRS